MAVGRIMSGGTQIKRVTSQTTNDSRGCTTSREVFASPAKSSTRLASKCITPTIRANHIIGGSWRDGSLLLDVTIECCSKRSSSEPRTLVSWVNNITNHR
ncbi:hypothetical protein FRC03_004528 [Tulasnella sp. 419]|nr:hypothetical protein FRC03_004528 [Tulasnella sp. 419]